MPRLRLALLAVLFLGDCTRRRADDDSTPTMVPNAASGDPASGLSPLGVGTNACARYATCCQAMARQTGVVGGPQANACAQIASLSATPEGDRTCATGLEQIASALAASGQAVPPVCRATPTLGLASGGSGISLGGMFGIAGPGRSMPLRIGTTVTGRLEVGDTVLPDGALADDYVGYLAAGSSVTFVARGGPTTDSSGATLDMYIVLMLNGTEVTHDDDSAGSLNSRIVYSVPTSGIYTLRIRTFSSGPHHGSYTLVTLPGALPGAT